MQRFERRLKTQGHNLTSVRRTIFAVLLEQDALSISELVKACPLFDRASIYRTVQLFEQLGIVQRIQIGWKYKLELSDDYQDHHHHMLCLACDKVYPLDEDIALEASLQHATSALDFHMYEHQLEVQGLCGTCKRARRQADPARLRPQT